MATKLQLDLLEFMGPPSSYYLIGDHEVRLNHIDFAENKLNFSWRRHTPDTKYSCIEFPSEFRPAALEHIILEEIVKEEDESVICPKCGNDRFEERRLNIPRLSKLKRHTVHEPRCYIDSRSIMFRYYCTICGTEAPEE